MKEKGDPCILVGYSTQSKGYRVYNKRTKLIVESIHLRFDEIKEMSETSVANDTSGLVPQRQKASDYDNPDPAPELQNVSPLADTTVPSQQEYGYIKNHKKTVKNGQTRTRETEEYKRAKDSKPKLKEKSIPSSATRRQLATDPKMCMFALTVSIVERKNKEAMADSAWIEVMQEELHQFDMTTSLGIVDKPLHEHNQL
ncbi:gag-pol polyprotein [Tanacetum coccineum]